MSIYLGNLKVANTGGGDAGWYGTRAEYEQLKALGQLDMNTTYYTTDDGDFNDDTGTVGGASEEQINELKEMIKALINDSLSSSTTSTYSSKKIEDRLNEVENTITGGQNDSVKMWQKTYLNVSNGSYLNIGVSGDMKLEKAIVQAYKFIEGLSDTIEILKKFDNTDASNFNYDSNFVEFNGNMRIKDAFDLNKTLNSDGYYETNLVSKNRFIDFYKIEEGV